MRKRQQPLIVKQYKDTDTSQKTTSSHSDSIMSQDVNEGGADIVLIEIKAIHLFAANGKKYKADLPSGQTAPKLIYSDGKLSTTAEFTFKAES